MYSQLSRPFPFSKRPYRKGKGLGSRLSLDAVPKRHAGGGQETFILQVVALCKHTFERLFRHRRSDYLARLQSDMGAHNHNSAGKKVEELSRDQAFSLKCKGRYYTIWKSTAPTFNNNSCVFLEMASARIGKRFRLDLG